MRNLIVLGALTFTLFAQSATSAERDVQYIRSVRLNACNYWTYSNEARGYVCSGYPSTETVAEADSVEAENRELRRQIDDLERRIRLLEAQP